MFDCIPSVWMPSVRRNIDAKKDFRNGRLEANVAKLLAANIIAEGLRQKNKVVLRPGERIVARAEPACSRVDHFHLELGVDRAHEKVGKIRLAEEHHFFKWYDSVVVLEIR